MEKTQIKRLRKHINVTIAGNVKSAFDNYCEEGLLNKSQLIEMLIRNYLESKNVDVNKF